MKAKKILLASAALVMLAPAAISTNVISETNVNTVQAASVWHKGMPSKLGSKQQKCLLYA